MTFNETFSHETKNNTEKTRLILFYDVTRPQKNRNLQFIAEDFATTMTLNNIVSASQHNDHGDKLELRQIVVDSRLCHCDRF